MDGDDTNILFDPDLCLITGYLIWMSVITQDGDSALIMAARDGRTEVVSLLLEAGANIHLQNKVKCRLMCTRRCDSTVLL